MKPTDSAFPGEYGEEGYGNSKRIGGKDTERWVTLSPGVSARDWLATAAMQGMLSNPAFVDSHDQHAIDWISAHAYLQADSMLTESRKEITP
jgi:hypothetical protein